MDVRVDVKNGQSGRADLKLIDSEKGRVGRRTIVKGAAWSLPVVAVAGAVPAFAASQVCAPVSGSYGTAPLVRNPATSGVPFSESSNSATATITQVYADNRAARGSGNNLQYVRTIPLSLTAGCCYTFTSASYASAAAPYSAASSGVSGLIFFENETRFNVATRGVTFSDWPGATQVNVGTDPANGVRTSFSFRFCATETRVHNYYQFFRVAPAGVPAAGNPGTSDDLRFEELIISVG